MRTASLVVCASVGWLAACVPADDASAVGSVQFTFAASAGTRGEQLDEGSTTEVITIDGAKIRFDRVVLSFKTMTIGKIGEAERCSYRGRGAVTDVVFDPRKGIVQTFNGIEPVDCPDVGIIFGPPGPTTTLADGATPQDLFDLIIGAPAHAIVEATISPREVKTPSFGGSSPKVVRPLRVILRFDSERTASRFGGCRDGIRSDRRGIIVPPGGRAEAMVQFAAEGLFREAITANAGRRVDGFRRADEYGNDDGIVTMNELDGLRVDELPSGYDVPNELRNRSFGDYLRVLFRFLITFRSVGTCIGNEPGEEEGGP
jgi:hypothetical protein